MKCRNCKKERFKRIIDLGSQPISSVFFNKKKYNLKKYPLNLYECKNCKLIQFSRLAPLKEMYGSTYGYRTSLSNLMINHMKKKYEQIKKMSFLKPNSNILDIGSNDGTFLQEFKAAGYTNILGVEPAANIAELSNNSGVPTVQKFWDRDTT